MRTVSRFITTKLKLVVNEQKSEVSRPWHSKYLGFRITRMFGTTRIGIELTSALLIHADAVTCFVQG